MKELISILILISGVGSASGQNIISNKLDVFLGYAVNNPLGRKDINREGYTSPSLINNFKKGNSFSLEVCYKLRPQLSFSIYASQSNLKNWSHPELERFKGANYSNLSIIPAFGIRTPFREKGFWNRFTLDAAGGVGIAMHSVNSGRAVYSSETMSDLKLAEDTFITPGLRLSISGTLALSNQWTMGLSYSVDHCWLSSVIFEDTALTLSSVTIRLGVRFGRNKRFKYAS